MKPNVRALVNRLFGDRGERAAARFLRGRGLRVLLRGYRTSLGEIEPADAVNFEKQRRLTLAALHFQRRYNLLEQVCRFDIVAIVWPDDRKPPQIDHIRNAFEAVGRGQMFR